MCSINGIYFGNICPKETAVFFNEVLKDIICLSTDRGVDAFGYTRVSKKGEVHSYKYINEVSVSAGRKKRVANLHSKIRKCKFLEEGINVVISNLRAEPTTEHLSSYSESDIQPYNYSTVYAVHNGTICNDKEILKGVDRSTKIDSYAIPYCASTNRMSELDGAIASVWIDIKKPNILHLCKNFAPIEVYYLYEYDCFIFSSLARFVEPVLEKYNLQYNHIKFPPYREMILSRSGFKLNDFYTVEDKLHKESMSKAVVICSGGLDSTVAATLACKEGYNEVTLLHFLYGCKAEKKEQDCVKNITAYLQDKYKNTKVSCEFIDLSFLKNLGGSTIIDGTDSDIGKPIEGSEKDIDWVPARNTAFIGLVASYCDRHNIGNIYTGLNLEESGAYRDNQTVFMEKFNEVLQLGCHSKPIIHPCLENLVKHEIVKLGIEIEAPLHLTWSCYRDHEKPCGNCGPCSLRRLAFKINGLDDPQEYEQDVEFDY